MIGLWLTLGIGLVESKKRLSSPENDSALLCLPNHPGKLGLYKAIQPKHLKLLRAIVSVGGRIYWIWFKVQAII